MQYKEEIRDLFFVSEDYYLGSQAGILGNSITEMKASYRTYVCKL